MSNPFIQTDVKEALELLNKLQAKTSDLTVPMRTIAGIMADSVEENFDQQGRPKWKDLAPSTKKQRTKQGKWPGEILHVSGDLAGSISQKSDAKSAQVGTNIPYAAIHQFGGMAGKNKNISIKARPFLWLGEDDLNEIKEYLTNELTKV